MPGRCLQPPNDHSSVRLYVSERERSFGITNAEAVQSRRLRHICGIRLRNLNTGPQIGLQRHGTPDDDALPSAPASSVESSKPREQCRLVQSCSSDDIRSSDPTNVGRLGCPGHVRAVASASAASLGKKSRRRSTLQWATSTQVERQTSLQAAVERRTADVFLSLHVDEVEGDDSCHALPDLMTDASKSRCTSARSCVKPRYDVSQLDMIFVRNSESSRTPRFALSVSRTSAPMSVA